MYLYLYHFEQQNIDHENGMERKNSSDFSDRMVMKALRDFSCRENLGIAPWKLQCVTIEREEKGKPYFTISKYDKGDKETPKEEAGFPVHYSVSHSGDWWGCLMALEPVGFDLEACREKVNFEKVARRFFTEEEYQFVLTTGREGFFELWVRKEAYIKYTGTGLAEGLNSFAVIRDGNISNQVLSKKTERQKQAACVIRPCELNRELKAAYCSTSGNGINAVIPFDNDQRSF